MNFDHLHLLLNHVPIIGFVVALALFLASFAGGNADLRRSALIVFAVVALVTIPTFVSGIAADRTIANEAGVSEALVKRHEGAAMLGLWFVMATGGAAMTALWRCRRTATGPPRADIVAVLLLSTMATGLMARTGDTGGDIRHPQPGTAQGAPVVEGTVGAIIHAFEPAPDGFTDLMVATKWWWATMMVMHFVGLSLIVGVVGAIDLRIMGFARELPLAPLHRLLPLAMAGLGLNFVTGMLAFIGMPVYYAADIAFWLKLCALMLLGLNAALFYLTGIFDRVDRLGPGEDAALSAKIVAASSLLLWFAVIVCGRYIQRFEDSLRF
jgi:uncharacterized membrane protein